MKRNLIFLAIFGTLIVAGQYFPPSGGGSATPSGSAGGDLSGEYPNPTVAKVNGKSVSVTDFAAGQTWVYDGSGLVPGTIGSSGVKPGSVKIQSSTVLLINEGCSAGDPCNLGQFTFTGSATATITAGSGNSGTDGVKVYRSAAGAVIVSHPTGAGLSITCVGCTAIQTTTPAFPSGSLGLYTATVTSGLWTAKTDVRSFVSDGIGTPSSGLKLLETATASNAAALTFDDCISSSYDYYKVHLRLTTANDGVGVGIQFAVSGVFDTGTNYESAIAQATSGGTAGSGGTGLTNLSMNNSVSNVAGYSFTADITLEDVNQVALFRTASGTTSGRIASGDARFFFQGFVGRWTNTADLYNQFRIIAGSGNVTGTGYCYGLAK